MLEGLRLRGYVFVLSSNKRARDGVIRQIGPGKHRVYEVKSLGLVPTWSATVPSPTPESAMVVGVGVTKEDIETGLPFGLEVLGQADSILLVRDKGSLTDGWFNVGRWQVRFLGQRRLEDAVDHTI